MPSRHPVTNALIRLPALAAIGAAIGVVMAGHDALAQPLVLLAVMLAPALLPRRILYPPQDGSEPDAADGNGNGNGDGGGGRGPHRDSPKPPDGSRPGGGIPLPDSQPARVRIRDHRRPVLAPRPPRRAGREPERRPERVPHRDSAASRARR